MNESNYAMQAKVQGGEHLDLTVRDNIDRQIGRLKAQLIQLESSKANLAPLLDMKISDIQRAMNY